MEENTQNISYNRSESQIDPTNQTVESNRGNHNLRTMTIITIGLIVLISAAVWMFYRADKKTDPTPEETLQSLKESSLPVTQSEEEQVKQIDPLTKGSEPVKTNEEDRLNQLKALSQ